MQLKIKTNELKEMLSKSIKGAGNNKLLPLTGLMLIQAKNGKFTLVTTDSSNYLYVTQNIENKDDFYVVIEADKFSKLISRMTCENIVLEITEAGLKVVGNGTYIIDIPLDESGEFIKYPDPMENLTFTENAKQINISTIRTVLTSNKAAVATTMEIPCYTGYYVGANIITTDTFKICGVGKKLFDDAILLPPELVNLLEVCGGDKIDACVEGDAIIFGDGICCIYGKRMDGIDDFAVDAITGLLNQEFDSSCKLDKTALLAVLDRISLFVGPYDARAIRLTFTEKGLNIESKQSNGVEIIDYVAIDNFKPFTCLIDIEMLIQQIKANSADVINLQYGNDKSVKIVDGDVTQIIALVEDVQ